MGKKDTKKPTTTSATTRRHVGCRFMTSLLIYLLLLCRWYLVSRQNTLSDILTVRGPRSLLRGHHARLLLRRSEFESCHSIVQKMVTKKMTGMVHLKNVGKFEGLHVNVLINRLVMQSTTGTSGAYSITLYGSVNYRFVVKAKCWP